MDFAVQMQSLGVTTRPSAVSCVTFGWLSFRCDCCSTLLLLYFESPHVFTLPPTQQLEDKDRGFTHNYYLQCIFSKVRQASHWSKGQQQSRIIVCKIVTLFAMFTTSAPGNFPANGSLMQCFRTLTGAWVFEDTDAHGYDRQTMDCVFLPIL